MNTRMSQIRYDDVLRVAQGELLPSTFKTYRKIWAQWVRFCESRSVHFLDATPESVRAFLDAHGGTKSVRKTRLMALRTLLSISALLASDAQVLRELMRLRDSLSTSMLTDSEVISTTRNVGAADVKMFLDYWHGKGLIGARNRALLSLLFYLGLRRNEVAKLLWADWDTGQGTLLVESRRDGSRCIPVPAGVTRELEAWRKVCPLDCPVMFPSITLGGKVRSKHHFSSSDVYRIVKATADALGVDVCPHDAHKTFVVSLLDSDDDDVLEAQRFVMRHDALRATSVDSLRKLVEQAQNE